MITGTSASFTAQVEGVEQVATWRMQMTLPGGVFPDVTLAVDQMSINASTTSDMPEQTRLQVGYPAMSCSFTLSGLVDVTDESKTAAWLFGPYSTTSPLYQKDALYAAVTVDIGLNTDNGAGTTTQGTPEYVRKFTGLIDDYTVGDDGTVSFTCIEKMRQQLRNVPAIPGVVLEPPSNAGLTSEYVIDALLRSATGGAVSTWPSRRANCVLAVGLRTSLNPELGSFLPGGPEPAYLPGIFGSALVPAGDGFTAQTFVLDASLAGPTAFEFWASNLTAGGDVVEVTAVSATSPASVQVAVFRNQVLVGVVDALGNTDTWTQAVPAGSGHYVSAWVSWNIGASTWSTTLRVDATTYTSGTRTIAFTRPSQAFARCQIIGQAGTDAAIPSIEALQVTGEPTPGPYNNAFTPAPTLDPSLNGLQLVPSVEAGADPYQVIQQIADAELAVAGGDESGVFRFYNRNTIAGTAGTPARTVTSSTSLKALGSIATAAAGVANRATADSTSYNFATVGSTVWALATPTKVPRGSTITIDAVTDGMFALIATAAVVMPNGTTAAGINYYRASTTKAGAVAFGGALTFTFKQTGPNSATITISNPTAQDAWLVSPASFTDIPVGTPLLQLNQAAVSANGSQTADFQYPPADNGGAAVTRFGEVAVQLPSNPYRQSIDSADRLVQDIVVDQCNTRPNLTGVAIVPDPRLQLIDVVRIQDPDVTGIDEYARVFGWTINWDPSSFEMTIDARTLAAPGGWIMGVAGRSEIGSTAYVYPST